MQQGHTNITVVSYNRLEYTRQTLAAIRATADADYSLVVVDNGSTDGSAEYLTQEAAAGRIDAFYPLARNMGVSCAVNHGWDAVPADFYLRLDNDIVFTRPDWLSSMTGILARNPELGFLSCPVYRTPADYKKLKLLSGEVVTYLHQACSPGGISMLRRDVFQKLGYWCEDYGTYGAEDGDYCKRMDLLNHVRAYWPVFDWGEHIGHEDAGMAGYGESKAKRQAAHQRDNVGLFRINVFLYEYGMRPLRVERKFLPQDARADGKIPFKIDPEYARRHTFRVNTMRGLFRTLEREGRLPTEAEMQAALANAPAGPPSV